MAHSLERVGKINQELRPRLAAEAGLHFFRLLGKNGVGNLRAAYMAVYLWARGPPIGI